MSRPVSIIVWRDAKTDPPKGDMARTVVALYGRYPVAVRAYAVTSKAGVWWAELPVVSDLTDDDVRDVASDSDYVADLWKRHGLPHAETRARADRLRAALGGEKEET